MPGAENYTIYGKKMTTETNEQASNFNDDFYTPEWWDNWSRKNLKRKLKNFPKNYSQYREE
jgi:hypothetical protein